MEDKQLASYLIGKLEKRNFQILIILVAFLISTTCCLIKFNNMEKQIKEQIKINETLKSELKDDYYWWLK